MFPEAGHQQVHQFLGALHAHFLLRMLQVGGEPGQFIEVLEGKDGLEATCVQVVQGLFQGLQAAVGGAAVKAEIPAIVEEEAGPSWP